MAKLIHLKSKQMIHTQNKNKQHLTLKTLTEVEWGQDLMKSGRPLIDLVNKYTSLK